MKNIFYSRLIFIILSIIPIILFFYIGMQATIISSIPLWYSLDYLKKNDIFIFKTKNKIIRLFILEKSEAKLSKFCYFSAIVLSIIAVFLLYFVCPPKKLVDNFEKHIGVILGYESIKKRGKCGNFLVEIELDNGEQVKYLTDKKINRNFIGKKFEYYIDNRNYIEEWWCKNVSLIEAFHSDEISVPYYDNTVRFVGVKFFAQRLFIFSVLLFFLYFIYKIVYIRRNNERNLYN